MTIVIETVAQQRALALACVLGMNDLNEALLVEGELEEFIAQFTEELGTLTEWFAQLPDEIRKEYS